MEYKENAKPTRDNFEFAASKPERVDAERRRKLALFIQERQKSQLAHRALQRQHHFVVRHVSPPQQPAPLSVAEFSLKMKDSESLKNTPIQRISFKAKRVVRQIPSTPLSSSALVETELNEKLNSTISASSSFTPVKEVMEARKKRLEAARTPLKVLPENSTPRRLTSILNAEPKTTVIHPSSLNIEPKSSAASSQQFLFSISFPVKSNVTQRPRNYPIVGCYIAVVSGTQILRQYRITEKDTWPRYLFRLSDAEALAKAGNDDAAQAVYEIIAAPGQPPALDFSIKPAYWLSRAEFERRRGNYSEADKFMEHVRLLTVKESKDISPIMSDSDDNNELELEMQETLRRLDSLPQNLQSANKKGYESEIPKIALASSVLLNDVVEAIRTLPKKHVAAGAHRADNDALITTSSVSILTPVRASRKDRQELGVQSVVTPVRRSVRQMNRLHIEPVNVETLLDSTDYAYAPNQALANTFLPDVTPRRTRPGFTPKRTISIPSFEELEEEESDEHESLKFCPAEYEK